MGNQTVLITGANRGIGLELTRQYCSQGARVFACCRDPDGASALGDIDGDVERIRLDVNSDHDLAALRRKMADQSLDVVINNAGVYGPRTTGNPVDRDGWHTTFATNVMGPMDVALAVKPCLERSRGVLANITSRMGSIADNDSGGSHIYRSSKAALNAAMKSIAIDWQNTGVTVLLLHPGWVETDMGGPNALISADTSVRGLMSVIGRAKLEDSGSFFNYLGDSLPW